MYWQWRYRFVWTIRWHQYGQWLALRRLPVVWLLQSQRQRAIVGRQRLCRQPLSGNFSQSGGTQTTSNLYVQNGTYNIGGAALASATNAYVGGVGEGSVNQTGGTQTITNLDVAYGNYNLGGNGLLLSSNVGVGGLYPLTAGGGPASFNQTGGTHSVANVLTVGFYAGASYNLSGNALLSAATFYVDGGGGSFPSVAQSAAAKVATNLLCVNGGIYNLSDSAALSASTIEDAGNVVQSGGTNAVATSINLGYNGPLRPPTTICFARVQAPYSLSGNALLSSSNIYVGYGQGICGQFSQSGGTNTVGSLYVGYTREGASESTYTLAGTALLSAGNTYVVDGAFTQTGGTHNVSNILAVGSDYANNSNASYTISGNSLLSAKFIDVGGTLPYSGTGTITQSGGTVAVAGSLTIGANGYGNYDLNGGDLLISSLIVNQGSGAFNFNGGTIQAAGSFSIAAPLALDDADGNATIDTAGYTVTSSGNLSGPGNLIEAGGGKLILSGTNSYTGGTTVSGGTLVVTRSKGLADDSNLIIGDAAAFAPVVAANVPPGGSPASPVPEPSMLALVASAAILLAAYQLRRRRKA